MDNYHMVLWIKYVHTVLISETKKKLHQLFRKCVSQMFALKFYVAN